MTHRVTYTYMFGIAVLLLSSTPATAQNPVPFLTQPLVPSAVVPRRPALVYPLVVNGTGFVPGATVNWNGKPRITAFVNRSQLRASILSSDPAVPTTGSITVVNPKAPARSATPAFGLRVISYATGSPVVQYILSTPVSFLRCLIDVKRDARIGFARGRYRLLAIPLFNGGRLA